MAVRENVIQVQFVCFTIYVIISVRLERLNRSVIVTD